MRFRDRVKTLFLLDRDTLGSPYTHHLSDVDVREMLDEFFNAFPEVRAYVEDSILYEYGPSARRKLAFLSDDTHQRHVDAFKRWNTPFFDRNVKDDVIGTQTGRARFPNRPIYPRPSSEDVRLYFDKLHEMPIKSVDEETRLADHVDALRETYRVPPIVWMGAERIEIIEPDGSLHKCGASCIQDSHIFYVKDGDAPHYGRSLVETVAQEMFERGAQWLPAPKGDDHEAHVDLTTFLRDHASPSHQIVAERLAKAYEIGRPATYGDTNTGGDYRPLDHVELVMWLRDHHNPSAQIVAERLLKTFVVTKRA